ncbi:MAG: homoserine lactone transporter [Desulfobulbus propionicus]|nr:MAG: homoserine lactone transporter [Desulfobulbus propionicus]
MFGIENYFCFLAAGILFSLTPGPDLFYIISRSISQGTQAGVLSVLGVSTGAIGHTLLAAFGLSVILTTSATLFFIVKIAGAFYLTYLGIMLIKSPARVSVETHPNEINISLRKIYFQGVVTNLLNPKVALFFLAFLPQFVQSGSGYGPLPFLLLGGTYVATGALCCCLLAFGAGKTTTLLRRNGRVQASLQKLTGFLFIGFGIQLAFAHS